MRPLKFLSVCVLSLCFTNGCETWKDAASVPQSSPSPASTELPRKDYFANHKTGEKPTWQLEYFRDAHNVFSPIPRLCRMHQDWNNEFLFNDNFNYLAYHNRYRPNQSLGRVGERYAPAWFNRLARMTEAVDRAGRVIFTGKDCKKQIALGLEFLNQHDPIAYNKRYASDQAREQEQQRLKQLEQETEQARRARDQEQQRDNKAERAELFLNFAALFYSYTKVYEWDKPHWDFYVQYGAPPVSANLKRMIRQEIPGLYKTFSACSKKLGGAEISESSVERFIETSNDKDVKDIKEMLDMMKRMGYDTRPLKVPTREQLNNAADFEQQVSLLALKPLYDFLDLAKIKIKTDKNWCETFKNSK